MSTVVPCPLLGDGVTVITPPGGGGPGGIVADFTMHSWFTVAGELSAAAGDVAKTIDSTTAELALSEITELRPSILSRS
jgi:hypothetical protein